MKQTAMHTTSPWAPPELQPGVTAVLIISGLFMLAFGIWAFFAPASFAEFVAFPYNRHLLHDVGAFQIGIGTTVMLALLWADSIMVVLSSSKAHRSVEEMRGFYSCRDQELSGALERWQEKRKVRNDPV